ncbi:MAG: hypothetical protein IPJ07_17930 [Acidobacteria bacterium]|nr:hypothetical protein [Acidobacteriota bacterium]
MIAFVAIGGIILSPLNALIDDYSLAHVSSSMAMSKIDGVFVSACKIDHPVVKIEDYEVAIEEAWIEEITESKHWFLFKIKQFPKGHRVVVLVSSNANDSAEKSTVLSSGVLNGRLLVNENVEITGVISSIKPNTWLYYGEIEQPLPQVIELSYKRKD